MGREWTEDGQLWVQYVSSTPATRLDVINLQEELDRKLQQRQARETGICPVREELYSQTFDELIRQVMWWPVPAPGAPCACCWSPGRAARPGGGVAALRGWCRRAAAVACMPADRPSALKGAWACLRCAGDDQLRGEGVAASTSARRNPHDHCCISNSVRALCARARCVRSTSTPLLRPRARARARDRARFSSCFQQIIPRLARGLTKRVVCCCRHHRRCRMMLVFGRVP